MRRGLVMAVGVAVLVGVGAFLQLGGGDRDVTKAVARAAALPEVKAVLTSPPLVPPPIDREGNARVVVTLETTETKGVLADGVEYTFWTFGGTVPGLFVRVRVGDLVELRLTDAPEGIEEAEVAAADLQSTIRPAPRVASVTYLDAIGLAASRLEGALGQVGGSPFAEAMKSGMPAAEELAAEVLRSYKGPLG